MFQPSSRYYSLETITYTNAAGQKIAYKRRRFVPPPSGLPSLAEVTVVEGDRLDLITHRTLGDPEQFWQVCDANTTLNPAEMTAEPGQRIQIPLPQNATLPFS